MLSSCGNIKLTYRSTLRLCLYGTLRFNALARKSIIASERFPTGGVFIFAMMASGGDLGASVGPQLVGVVTDAVIANPAISEFALSLALTPEQLGMKLGMLVGMLFPLAGIPLYLHLWKGKNKSKQ